MAMHHVTLECPVCDGHETAVSNSQHDRWHCFHCGAGGGLTMMLSIADRFPPLNQDKGDQDATA